ncbi:MAG: serine/threonine-protein phosphatase [Candidatus Eremiobacteraeota bacterium]|nr:serine/threonine-protein phosphatase [Candidatus Eremiobacteraeota bacterium]
MRVLDVPPRTRRVWIQSRWLLVALGLATWLDYLTPQSLTMSLFYGLVCLLTGVTLSGRAAVTMAFAAMCLHCLVSPLPNPWYVSALQDVSEFCLLAIVGLEAGLLRDTIEETRMLHGSLRAHLESAREVQKALLTPSGLGDLPVEIAVRFDIAVELGGDFFFVKPDAAGLLFCVADVSGKGPAAALISSLLRGLLEELAGETLGPAHLLARLQRRLQGLLPENTFITCFCGWLDYERGQIVYASAGHDPPFLRRGGELLELPAQSLPLGVEFAETFEESSVAFQGEDLLVVYTDGLTDSRQGGEEPVRRVLSEHQGSCEALTTRLFELLPESLVDDVMLLALRCRAGSAPV